MVFEIVSKRWPLYLGLGFASYLLFLVATIPSAWLAWGLIKLTNGAVRLETPAGSLWKGSSALTVLYPRATPHELGEAAWSINPLWLFTGRVRVALQTSASGSRMTSVISLSPGKLTLTDTEIELPAQRIGEFYRPAILIEPEGTVRLLADDLALGRASLTGAAQVHWQGAASRLSPVRPLGDYRLDITGEGKTAALALTTESGDLSLAGQGKWDLQNGHLQFDGTATPRARRDDLEPLLKLLGRDMGNGRRALSLNARL